MTDISLTWERGLASLPPPLFSSFEPAATSDLTDQALHRITRRLIFQKAKIKREI